MKSRFEENKVYGLRDVGEYKVYRKGNQFFAGHKNHERFRRIQLDNAKTANALAVLPKSDLVAAIQQRLDGGKRAGSPLYFEVKHP